MNIKVTNDTSSKVEEWSRRKLFDEVRHSINGNNSEQALLFLDKLRWRCMSKDYEVSSLIEKLEDAQARD